MKSFRDMACTPDECRVPIGVYYRAEAVPTYEDGLSAAQTPGWKRATQAPDISRLIEELV